MTEWRKVDTFPRLNLQTICQPTNEYIFQRETINLRKKIPKLLLLLRDPLRVHKKIYLLSPATTLSPAEKYPQRNH